MSLLQLHMIKSFPASNLNRGEDGNPKGVWYGGQFRTRVSSQAVKSAIRASGIFRDGIGVNFAVRTRMLPSLVGDELTRMSAPEAKRAAIMKSLQQIGKSDKKEKEDGDLDQQQLTNQMLFFTNDEFENLVNQLAKQYENDPKMAGIEKVIRSIPAKAVDLAMFGRMSTSAAFDRIDAATQFAHWISVQRVITEQDYIVAIDELSDKGGLITSAQYSAPIMYGYANIDFDSLVKNLVDDRHLAVRAVQNLIKAFALVNPTGSQNRYAAHVVPDLLIVEWSSKKIPINYAPAFAQPIQVTAGQSMSRLAINALSSYMANVDNIYGVTRERRLSLDISNQFDSMDNMLSEVGKWLTS